VLRALALLAAVSTAARAEVGPEQRIVEDTAFTLRAGEIKLGVLESSYGLTDRVQLDTVLLGDAFTLLNAGVKVTVLNEPALALALHAAGGRLLAIPGNHFWTFSAGFDASMPLGEALWLHVSGGGHVWGYRGDEIDDPLARSLRLAWLSVQAQVEWDFTPQHVFFVTAGTPTSWLAAGTLGSQDFDALDFARYTVGWQLSLQRFNFRVDAGYGPSIKGRGLTGSLDFYWRL
jgi:hypothetical protein